MAKKRYSAEQIIQLQREVEIHTSEGKTISQASRQIGVTELIKDELINGKIFTSEGGSNTNREIKKGI